MVDTWNGRGDSDGTSIETDESGGSEKKRLFGVKK